MVLGKNTIFSNLFIAKHFTKFFLSKYMFIPELTLHVPLYTNTQRYKHTNTHTYTPQTFYIILNICQELC